MTIILNCLVGKIRKRKGSRILPLVDLLDNKYGHVFLADTFGQDVDQVDSVILVKQPTSNRRFVENNVLVMRHAIDKTRFDVTAEIVKKALQQVYDRAKKENLCWNRVEIRIIVREV